MIRSVKQPRFDIYHWIACKHAVLQCFFNAFTDGRDEFFWNHPTDDVVLKFKSLARFVRRKFDPDVAELAVTAGLPHESTFLFDGLANRFAIRPLRRADVCLALEF